MPFRLTLLHFQQGHLDLLKHYTIKCKLFYYICNTFSLFIGTRIYYDRQFLLQCRNSPLTKSPPSNMVKIPGVTVPITEEVENGHVSVVEKKQGS